jgi:AcrR family transcriptional regulator
VWVPRDSLTPDRIVRAAIELLDEHGLEGFNMRSLGEQLGSAPTAVYWHVGSKQNLIGLAGDEVWNEIELPDLGAVDWRSAASMMATDLYGMLTRHPWLVSAVASQPLYGPGKARHDEHSLAVYEKAGFIGADADRAAATVFTFVLGNAFGPAAEVSLVRRLRRQHGDPEQLLSETMSRARTMAERFPRLRARLGSAAAARYGAAPEKAFEFGLEVILDGLENELAARTRPSH